MKTQADIESRLRLELTDWNQKQCQDVYSDFYLYYLPTTSEHIGGILIAKDAPANGEYQLAWNERINKAATIDQNMNRLRDVIRRLPILEYE